jgi:mevalonate kinase
MMSKQLTARSPGKLILSGEHAVVYGKPALAMAVNRYAQSRISSHFTPAIFFNLLNLRYAKSLTLSTLTALKTRLQENYNDFLQGQCGIRDVLKKPFELLQYTVSNVIEKLNMTLPHGVEIKTSSTIPMGCGMGSSAATVMSTLHALTHFFKLELEPLHYLHLGKEAENLQHGRSSGLDLQLAMQGGCLKFQEGKMEARNFPNFPLYIVQTGTPLSSTGECVAHVAAHLQQGTLLEDFEAITHEMDKTLTTGHIKGIQDCIRANHALLSTLAVVPAKVQTFIQALESLGAAAKICGAGAVKGDKGGVIWVVFQEAQNPHFNPALSHLLKEYDYTLHTLEMDRGGSHLV